MDNYSFIHNDAGYKMMKLGNAIARKFPYQSSIEPRLVRFLRSYVFYKLTNIKPCIPLVVDYWIRTNDLICIRNYLQTNSITLIPPHEIRSIYTQL